MPLFLETQLGYSKHQQASILSIYEVGVVLGAIVLGLISDICYSRRSPIGVVSVIFSSFVAFKIAFDYETLSQEHLTQLMFVLGFFVGSMHHLIVVTASADLGRQFESKKATSTITGIIDGIGSMGSGVG